MPTRSPSRYATSRQLLHGRRIVLGISGGVAAYKAAYLARRLLEAGAEVHAVMTRGATEFIGPQSLAAITGRSVTTTLFGDDLVSPHTELAAWADAIVVAPATANIIAKIANGISDDALAATVLAFDGPVVMAPAMHTEMFQQPSTSRNLAAIEADGRVVIGPVMGSLAGGDSGEGRMVEPEEIVLAAADVFDTSLADTEVLITAGGTREPIDPVRFIGNRSSGKMGHALANAAAGRGGRVTLVTTSVLVARPGVAVVEVETAEEMAAATWERAANTDIAILAAAVADFRPSVTSDTKLARTDGPPRLGLEPTPNVLAGVIERVGEDSIVVGFAAETGSLDRAVVKAKEYGVSLLVANDVSEPGSGFGSDTNAVTIMDPFGNAEAIDAMPKTEVAEAILDRIGRLR